VCTCSHAWGKLYCEGELRTNQYNKRVKNDVNSLYVSRKTIKMPYIIVVRFFCDFKSERKGKNEERLVPVCVFVKCSDFL